MTDDQAAAQAGGSAPQPAPRAGGPVPADHAAVLPEGFELPPGYVLVQIPEATPEQAVAGAWEHAAMLRGVADAAAADLDRIRAHAEGQVAAQADGAARCAQEADDAEQRARDLAAGHGIDLPETLPRHATYAYLDQPDTGGGEGDGLWPSPSPRS